MLVLIMHLFLAVLLLGEILFKIVRYIQLTPASVWS